MIIQDSLAARLPEQPPGMSMKLTHKLFLIRRGVKRGDAGGEPKPNQQKKPKTTKPNQIKPKHPPMDGLRIGREDHVRDQLVLLGVIFNQRLKTGLYTVQ